jgi:hypothetical protein
MSDYYKKQEPKKIKMPPLVDRSQVYDTLSFDNDTVCNSCQQSNLVTNEDNSENNSQGLSELESL